MKRNYSFSVIIIILITSLAALTGAQTVGVPLSDQGYDTIERWETRGLIDGVFNGTRPFSRLEMAGYVKQALVKYQKTPEKFTRVDQEELCYLALEFKEELEQLDAPEICTGWRPRIYYLMHAPLFKHLNTTIYTNNRNFLSFHHGEFDIYADPIFNVSLQDRMAATRPEDMTLFEGRSFSKKRQDRSSNGFLFRGRLGKFLGFYFNLTDNRVNDEYWKGREIPYEVLQESGWPYLTRHPNGSYEFDENVAYLTFNSKYFYALYGRDYNQWGVGHHGNLFLSTNAPVYDQIKMVIRYWRFKYTHLTAFLEYISPEGRYSIKAQPFTNVYWSGNRLELNAGRGLQLGFSESVVYGNRSLALGYLHPLTFYKSLEHYYGDRDNGALGFDFEWRLVPGLKVYGEWFIDDITTSKLGTDWYGNKFGWQGGFLLVNPFSLPDYDLLVEYTRIKPYVYSHSVQDYNKYKHYDTILGHFIGPNSDDIYTRLRKRFSKFLSVYADFEQYRHGSNPPDRNVGGDPDMPHLAGDSPDAIFLDGIKTTQKVWGGGLRYEFIRNLIAELNYHRIEIDQASPQNLISVRFSFNFGYRAEILRNIFPVTH